MAKIIGIMGGMGPLASVDLQEKIIKNTRARVDADHLHVITDCYSQIPDRSAHILGRGPDPLPFMIESARRLEKAGAEALLIACNTAHYYLEDLKKSVDIPFISLLESALREAKKRNVARLAILSTKATYELGLYQRLCDSYGISYVDNSPQDLDLLMKVIYQVKAGNMHSDLEDMRALVDKYKEDGAQSFILGCSELPIYFSHNDMGLDVLDPTLCLAREAIVYGGGQLINEESGISIP